MLSRLSSWQAEQEEQEESRMRSAARRRRRRIRMRANERKNFDEFGKIPLISTDDARSDSTAEECQGEWARGRVPSLAVRTQSRQFHRASFTFSLSSLSLSLSLSLFLSLSLSFSLSCAKRVSRNPERTDAAASSRESGLPSNSRRRSTPSTAGGYF